MYFYLGFFFLRLNFFTCKWKVSTRLQLRSLLGGTLQEWLSIISAYPAPIPSSPYSPHISPREPHTLWSARGSGEKDSNLSSRIRHRAHSKPLDTIKLVLELAHDPRQTWLCHVIPEGLLQLWEGGTISLLNLLRWKGMNSELQESTFRKTPKAWEQERKTPNPET